MTNEKPKIEFNEFDYDTRGVLYGEFVIGDYRYALEEFLQLLTNDQIRQFQRRLAMERAGD